MTDGVNTNLSLRLTATDSKAPPVGGASQSVNELFQLLMTPGTGVGKSDILYTRAVNIAASGSVTDTLSAVTDAFGVSKDILDVQAVMLVADPTNTNNIVLGNAATHPWQGPFDAVTDTVAVKPGGVLLWADPSGWPVTATSADQLKLANSGSGSAVTGTLIIIGRSA